LHIEAYHSQINNRKKSSALKSHKKSTRTKWKLKGKTVILFKEIKWKRFHIINTTDSRKFLKFKKQVKPKLNGKEQIINTSHISTMTIMSVQTAI